MSVLASPNSLRVCNWISEARSSWDQPTVAECAVRQPQSPERLRRHSTELLVSRATLLLLTVEPRLPPPCSQKATRTGRTCTPSALASVHDHGLAIGERATLDPRRSNSSWIPSSSRSPLRSTAMTGRCYDRRLRASVTRETQNRETQNRKMGSQHRIHERIPVGVALR